MEVCTNFESLPVDRLFFLSPISSHFLGVAIPPIPGMRRERGIFSTVSAGQPSPATSPLLEVLSEKGTCCMAQSRFTFKFMCTVRPFSQSPWRYNNPTLNQIWREGKHDTNKHLSSRSTRSSCFLMDRKKSNGIDSITKVT